METLFSIKTLFTPFNMGPHLYVGLFYFIILNICGDFKIIGANYIFMNISKFKDVTDTALWIAAYRAEESMRNDALFKDPYASLLIGDTGTILAKRTQGSRYTAWSVIIRTLIIDKFILDLIPNDIDTVINLGAGLDTRPYRLGLPKNLRWIEIDFPTIIKLKK